jgi:cation:H+ antiporter
MTIVLLWLVLAAMAAVIVFTSRFLASSADVIAVKTGLGKSFVGVVMLATATSLPELGTGVSSILMVDQIDLAAGDAFGSNIFNLLIIGVIDMVWRNGPLLTVVGSTSIMIGALGIAVIATSVIAMLVHSQTQWAADWPVSPMSFVLLLVFVAGMYMIYKNEDSSQGHVATGTVKYEDANLTRAFMTYSLAALVIVAAAVVLANVGDRITDALGWEASFMGTQFLALSTSLPELATAYAAIKLGAPELAIANVLGSNLFNMGIVLFVDDIVYVEAPLWVGVADIHLLTAVLAIVMTTVVIIGLVVRPRRRLHKLFTYEALVLVALYIVTSVLVFSLG